MDCGTAGPAVRPLIGNETELQLQQGTLPSGSANSMEPAGEEVTIVPGSTLHQQWEQFAFQPFDLFKDRLLRIKARVPTFTSSGPPNFVIAPCMRVV